MKTFVLTLCLLFVAGTAVAGPYEDMLASKNTALATRETLSGYYDALSITAGMLDDRRLYDASWSGTGDAEHVYAPCATVWLLLFATNEPSVDSCLGYAALIRGDGDDDYADGEGWEMGMDYTTAKSFYDTAIAEYESALQSVTDGEGIATDCDELLDGAEAWIAAH